jgi:hypothetical protein
MCWILNLLLKFCRLQVPIWHTSMCLDTPVLCTYHHHNVTSLILELPNAFSQGTLKYKRDTGVMIPHYRKYMYQEMLDSLKMLLVTLPHVKERIILNCFHCLVLIIMIRIHALCHNRFLKLDSSPILINLPLIPTLLMIFRVHIQYLMNFSQPKLLEY